GMNTFGASAPLKELQRKFGFEPDQVVAAAKDLDFFWEQSLTGPTAGAPKAFPGSRPAGSIACAGLRWWRRKCRFNPTRDPNNVSQEAAIKQDPSDGLKAGSSACDAPQQTGRDHCHHNGGNWLAPPLRPRLFDSGGAQKARPDACLREDRRRARLPRHRE